MSTTTFNPADRAKPVERAAEWIYRGVWGVLAGLFKVPEHAPTLPAIDGHEPEKFRPSPRYLAMQKVFFWIWLAILDLAIFAIWLVVAITFPLAGGLLAIPMLILALVPDVVAYIAVHLRYDTMWYVMNDRSIRIRRGIWVIHETTITFENIQNVTVTQGPIQRLFGIATVVIQTAGGGGMTNPKHGGGGMTHMGLIEGIADAPRLRDLFLAKMRLSRGAGLGDDRHEEAAAENEASGGRGAAWSPAHIIALREMLAEAQRANAAVG